MTAPGKGCYNISNHSKEEDECMKRFFHGAEGILCIVLIILLAAALLGAGLIVYQVEQLPAFRDVTMELGSGLPTIEQFLTEFGDAEKAVLVTPAEQIDLTRVGRQQITFRQNGKEETVTLTIRDTTAPVVEFRDLTLPLGTAPRAEDLVVSVRDHDQVTVSFTEPPALPEEFGVVTANVLVTDASGNTVSGICTIHYVWLREEVTVELGDTLEIGDLLLREEDAALFTDQETVDRINASGLGTYLITGVNGDMTCQCTVTVRDTVGPELQVRTVLLSLGDTASAQDFVVSAQDLSGEVTVSLASEPDYGLLGSQTVTVEARDASGNVTSMEATLEIREDMEPPVFQGVGDMRVEIGSTPDYAANVVAVDNKDGYVEFTFQAIQEDTSKSGSYYVIYTAVDKAGNKATAQRRIIVDHDQADVNALVAKYADQLSDDPVEIMNWCYQNISYWGDSWGDGDPVWFGFTKWQGNCYVHAYCLQAILEHKGYETQIIWTTEKTHYWVLVNIGGAGDDAVWRHIDSTPGNIHLGYGLMDDEHRLWTLSGGRVWDFDQWPACE